ncbi:glycosyltransferase family 2 protein [Bradyrhizobium liaoningense]|uniref:glycosyltransferase family 2 protein n=1 Tax=Bradyrhizobium liaoningense TaxID=43992 RepID=UPI001BA6E74A|nr:glycosyltransferase family 2 protein [Bradyrhizobium liaoningense]MBR0843870.1 glycosyltransferase family 2 protein [Bradyrhizobium liaoningense]
MIEGGTRKFPTRDAAIEGPAGTINSCVHVVIPVFNRWHFTQQCIEDLRRQTYRPLSIIVSDGGSTDGTRDKLARLHPDVEVAYDGKERWWAGSCALAIDKLLAKVGSDDFVLLLNNDTRLPETYVETLVGYSRAHHAAVGAKIVDSRDSSKVLDAGEMIDWERYDFPVKTDIGESERYCDTVDTLPGRGSLVPIRMIREVGNIDDRRFPHYIADYDFFCRIKSAGFKLVVCYDTMVLAHIEETGIVPQTRLTLRQAWREIFDRRSMTNLRDHWLFVSRHAPAGQRARLHRKLIACSAGKVLLRTELGVVALPVYKSLYLLLAVPRTLRRLRTDPDVALEFGRWPRPVQVLALMTFSPRPFRAEEALAKRLDPASLVRDGIAVPLPLPGWYMFKTLRWPVTADASRLQELLRSCRGMKPSQLRAIVQYRRQRGLQRQTSLGGTEA